MSSDDIVERLRYGDNSLTTAEVIAKIERLRAAGDALVDAVLLQRWSTVGVAVAAWLEVRRE